MIMNQVFFAVLISSVTSTLLLLLWRLLRRFFMAVNPKMIYTTLRWICITYFLPIGYAAVLVTYRTWFQGKDEVWELVFAGTEEITSGLQAISLGWFLLVCALFAYRYIDNKIWCRKLEDNILENDRSVIRTFHRVCRRLGIPKGELFIHRNVLVTVPMIAGVRHPQVLLPEQEYTTEDLEIIFYHELSHYKHRDLKCKMIVVFLILVHCINPCVYVLLYLVNFWSECMADVTALEASGRLHNAKLYFDTIVKFLPKDRTAKREKFLFSTLYKNDRTLIKRTVFMRKYQNAKTAGRAVTAVFVAVFVLCSTAMVFASGKLVADIHSRIYQRTEEKKNETLVVADDGMLEHYCNIEDLDIDGMQAVSISEEGSMSEISDTQYIFDQTIQPNTRYVSNKYKVETGQYIRVSVVMLPNSVDYFVGILNENGDACYVENPGSSVAHHFMITENNSYQVFIQNNRGDGTGTFHANGWFMFGSK